MKRLLTSALAAGSALILAISLPAAASALEPAVGDRNDGLSQEVGIITVEAPDFISDEEMESFSQGEFTYATADSNARAGLAATLCTLDIGNVYKRTSGSPYPYGTVGAKPKTTCTGSVARIEQSTGIYIKTWGGWYKAAGDFNARNTGVASLQQTNVDYPCAGTTPHDFRVTTLGSVTYYGHSPVAGGAYVIGEDLPCS